MNPAEEFGLFYNISGDQMQWFNIDAGQTPFRQDIVLIPQGACSLYPRQGPHMIELYSGGRGSYYTAFLSQLQTIVTGWITRPDFDGLIVLDYEWFSPWWTGHPNTPSPEGPESVDWDPIDDWRETLRITRSAVLATMNPAQQENYFKQEWLTTTREFFERAVATIRAVRPLAKVGVYSQPCQDYWSWTIPSQAFRLQAGHDEVPWFWELVDVIIPSVYVFYKSVPAGQALQPGQDHQADFDAYLLNNLREAIRVSHGKPVYPYVSYMYHPSSVYANQPCNQYNLVRPLEIARELGCNGVVVWGWMRTQQEFDTQAPFFNDTVAPFLTQFSQLPALPRSTNNGIPDLGSQGGVNGSDGTLDQNDFISFVDQYFAHSYHADVGSQGGITGPDGILDNNDFVAFINLYMNGCNPR